jgi:chemotaxis signal transduction protein
MKAIAHPGLAPQARPVAGPGVAGASTLHLPFVVGALSFAIPYGQVARVTLPTGVASLARYPNLPPCIVGVAAADSEMLTVVDAGLLFGVAPIHHTMRSRLIVLSDGAMRGFALLVSRVMDMAPLERLADIEELKLTSADALGQALTVVKASNGAKQ